MYAQDSFFTLTTAQQIGLLGISVAFSLITIAIAWRLGRLPRLFAGPLAVGLFWIFAWLSPQGYYQYYRLIIDGLPAQWVVGSLPGIAKIWALLTFTGPATLSAHSLGAMGWIVIIAATFRRRTP